MPAVITLDGKTYVLANAKVETAVIQEWGDMLRTVGQQRRLDRQFVSQHVIGSFQGGFRWTRHDSTVDTVRFDDSRIDTRFRNHLIPAPGMFTPSVNGQQTTDKVVGLAESGSTCYAYCIRYNSTYDVNVLHSRTFNGTSWDVGSDIHVPQDPGPPITYFNVTDARAYGGYYIDIWQNTITSEWVVTLYGVDVATYPVESTTSLAPVFVFTSPLGGGWNWNGAGYIHYGGVTTPIVGAIQGATLGIDTTGTQALFYVTANGLYHFDLSTRASTLLSPLPYNQHNGVGMCFWNDILYVPVGSGMRRYSFSSGTMVWEDVSLDGIDGLSSQRQGYTTVMCPGAKQLFVAYGGQSASSKASIYSFYEDNWHFITEHPSTNTPFEYLAISATPDSVERLHATSTTSSQSTYFFVQYPEANTSASTSIQTYATSGKLRTPIYDLEMGEVPTGFYKLYCFGTFSANASVDVTYGVDGAAPTVSLGTFNSSTSVLEFGSGYGVSGKTIQFEFDFKLSGGTGTLDVSQFVLYYLKDPASRRTFQLQIDLAKTSSKAALAPATIVSNLKSLRDTPTLKDLVWGGNSAKVKILSVSTNEDMTELANESKTGIGNTNGGIVAVTAVEMP